MAPRISILRLMAIVALVALDFAVIRVLVDYCNPDLLVSIALSGVVLQFGLFLAIRTRNRARAFWIGFVLFGLATALLCCYALVDTDSTVADVLDEYLAFVTELTGVAVFTNGFLWSSRPSSTYDALVRQAEMAGVLALPQLVVGLLGGSTVFFPALLRKLCRRRPPRSTIAGLEHARHPNWLSDDCRTPSTPSKTS
jgi:hypothetical protein